MEENKKKRTKEEKSEIDYDKLAEAIIKAQIVIEQKKAEEKAIESYSSVNKSITSLTFFIMKAIELLGYLFSGLLAYSTYKFIKAAEWADVSAIIGNIITIIFMAVICVMVGLFSYKLEHAADEIKQEKDKYYIVSIFSGLVGFVALVIAVIALLKV